MKSNVPLKSFYIKKIQIKQVFESVFALGLLTQVVSQEAIAGLQLFSKDSLYVVLGQCGDAGEGVMASKVNQPVSSPLCLAKMDAVSSADASTRSRTLDLGNVSGTELIRVDSAVPTPQVKQIFSVIAPPANPLDLPVDRLHYFQASATGCAKNAIFSFTTVNDGRVQRGWGERDVRINSVYELPVDWTLERLRHEVLFEHAAFRGIVERPTFDILHPSAERPLLVTVFDLLPLVRSADRCE